jgi:hypothetical protein
MIVKKFEIHIKTLMISDDKTQKEKRILFHFDPSVRLNIKASGHGITVHQFREFGINISKGKILHTVDEFSKLYIDKF